MSRLVFLNGQIVPEERATVSVLDRGFLYGDGVFETMCVRNGRPFRWGRHMERLSQGLDRLGIPFRVDAGGLLASALGLIEANRLPDCVMRLTVTRGVGLRGYSPKGAEHPTVTITLHPAAAPGALPPAWRLATSSIRLPSDSAIARLKTCNKLPQILARAEADAAGADEALLLNTDGYVVEGASSNLFWLERDVLCTPPIDASGILPGVTRQTLCELARALPAPLKVEEKLARPEALLQADAVMVSLSTVGLAEAIALDGAPLRRNEWPGKLFAAYDHMVERETRARS